MQQLTILDWLKNEPEDTQNRKTVSIETLTKIIIPKVYPYEPQGSKTFCTYCHQMTNGFPCSEDKCPH
jgi:hypothetical protein